MSGRGYLKKRLEELKKLKEEADNSTIQQNVNGLDHMHENLSSSLCNGINKLLVPTAQSMMNQQSQPTCSATQKVNTIQPKINGVSTVCNGFHEKTAQPQSQSMMNPQQRIDTIIEEKDPVICRVPPVSAKNTYKLTSLESNYIKIDKKEEIGVYEYMIDFDPPVDVRSARFNLVNQHKNIFPVKTYDGTILCVPTKLQNNETVLTGTLADESKVTLRVTFKREKKLGECTGFYNVLLRSVMKCLGFVEFGRNCYDPNKTFSMRHYHLDIWPGYVTNIDEFENGLYLCCDVSHRVLRTETVLQSVMALTSNGHNSEFKQLVLALLIGSTVITLYNKKTYRIDDVDFSMTPLSKFQYQDTKISYVDYYKKMYGIEIKNLKQFMLITKSKKRTLTNLTAQDSDVCCLVPELCYLTGITLQMKEDIKLMKELRIKVQTSPQKRQNSLIDLVKRINGDPDASLILSRWGITLHESPVKLEGPVYQKETIIFGNRQFTTPNEKMDWGSNMIKNAMFISAKLYDWAIFHTPQDTNVVVSFVGELIRCANIMNMEIKPPMIITVPKSSPEFFVCKVNDIVQSYENLQLVVIVFPSQRNDYYNAIKRLCCAQLGIPSQVILSRTLNKKIRTITQKIALQINCKLGGACWAINIPLVHTMIVGIDVYHEKNKQTASVVGIVASLDKTFTKWCSIAKKQQSTHQELLSSIQISFHGLLKKYKEVNDVLPQKIIIYRDGVSDGELKAVNEYEINNLKECFDAFPGNYNPKITFIIVQKRINSRIFKFVDNKQYVNPPAGTVVDNTITRRNVFDFFLVSQNVYQGTVSPTHYIVLKNGCNLSTENVQRLTYKLCHLYYNWCGTIKVPCPIQYAHRLAYLIGENVGELPHEKLTNTLFFL